MELFKFCMQYCYVDNHTPNAHPKKCFLATRCGHRVQITLSQSDAIICHCTCYFRDMYAINQVKAECDQILYQEKEL